MIRVVAVVDVEFDSENVTIISGPTYEYVPTLDKFAFIKVEVSRGRTLIDSQRDREMIWQRHLWADSVTGTFEPLFSIPFGVAAVSGG